MHYHIDKTAAQSAYLQLYHQLRRDIVSGVYLLGTKMPSKRLIATETGVSVITVEHALAILCDEGYLESRERSGFFVSFAAADCFPVSETETERRTTVSHGTEDEFPFPSLAKTMRRVLSEYGESILVKSPNNGCAELRGAIAAYLSRSRGISVQPGQIVIGSGAEYLYGLIVQLLGRERVFALEDPSYDKIRRVYQAHGVTCEMLRLGSDGIRSDELTRASATVLHVTPFHSFPSQVTASAGKRREYLRWAEERGGYIVEDDYDAPFRLAGRPVASLASIDVTGHVIYTNTFSKSLGPALRMAFMVLPPRLAEAWDERVGFYANTVSVIDQIALARMIEEGDYERHVNRYRKVQRDVRDAFVDEMIRLAPSGRVRVEQADSGLHFVLSIEGADEEQIAAAALERGVRLSPMEDYAIASLPPHDDARFAIQYGGLDAESAREAARIIASCIG